MKKEKTYKLSCERARAFPIERALAKLGHFPARTTEKEAWFLSPFRPEAQASFKVSKRLNRWYDHGAGIGGNVIDLVIRIKDCPVGEALDFLKHLPFSFSFQQQPLEKLANTDHIEIIKVQTLHHFGIIDYLTSRGIRLGTARMFCKEVHYLNNGKHYFSIGLKNRSKGWELRNKYCKNSSSPKDISYFNYGKDRLMVIEGMFDFLSLISYDPSLVKTVDFLILNSISFVEKVLKISQRYTSIELYLDKDNAGRRATETFLERGKNYFDRSNLYEDHKDLNEMWIGRKR